MSVENFYQGDIFGDIFAAVNPKPSVKEVKPSTLKERAPLIATDLPPFKVIRSAKRKKSISALRRNGVIEIHIPARTTKREESELIPEMISLLLKRESRSHRTPEELEKRATALLERYLPEFEEYPASISWRQMRDRWGSCTTVDRTIRLSDRLITAPDFVLNWVLFHELIHLRIPNHGSDFTRLLSRFEESPQAQAYLDGYQAGLADGPHPGSGPTSQTSLKSD